ncbi:MAG TPA: hypothetical protein VL624_20410 [Caldimonas sp.]|nr:hypothetical protein [Caldimonas sp.]
MRERGGQRFEQHRADCPAQRRLRVGVGGEQAREPGVLRDVDCEFGLLQAPAQRHDGDVAAGERVAGADAPVAHAARVREQRVEARVECETLPAREPRGQRRQARRVERLRHRRWRLRLQLRLRGFGRGGVEWRAGVVHCRYQETVISMLRGRFGALCVSRPASRSRSVSA